MIIINIARINIPTLLHQTILDAFFFLAKQSRATRPAQHLNLKRRRIKMGGTSIMPPKRRETQAREATLDRGNKQKPRSNIRSRQIIDINQGKQILRNHVLFSKRAPHETNLQELLPSHICVHLSSAGPIPDSRHKRSTCITVPSRNSEKALLLS